MRLIILMFLTFTSCFPHNEKELEEAETAFGYSYSKLTSTGNDGRIRVKKLALDHLSFPKSEEHFGNDLLASIWFLENSLPIRMKSKWGMLPEDRQDDSLLVGNQWFRISSLFDEENTDFVCQNWLDEAFIISDEDERYLVLTSFYEVGSSNSVLSQSIFDLKDKSFIGKAFKGKMIYPSFIYSNNNEKLDFVYSIDESLVIIHDLAR